MMHSRSKRFGLLGIMCCAAGLLLCGCGGGAKDPSKVGSQYSKLFASADPEVKGCWDSAMAAMKTNGFAVATVALQQLVTHTNVTPEQGQAARDTVTAVSDKMYEALNKGDPAAKQAVEDLRKATAR